MTSAADTAPRVTLLTRQGCHLCAVVRVTVRDVCAASRVAWSEVDVDGDEDLRGEYGDQVPVVLVDDEFVAAFELDAKALVEALNRPV